MKLQCSHYFPLDARSADGKLPVVVYCHCNSGSRRDAEEAVYHLLPCGVGVVAFDFTVSWGLWHALGLHISTAASTAACSRGDLYCGHNPANSQQEQEQEQQ